MFFPKDIWSVILESCDLFTIVNVSCACTFLRERFKFHPIILYWKNINATEGLSKAVFTGNLRLVKLMVAKQTNTVEKWRWFDKWNGVVNDALSIAAKMNNREVVDLLFDKKEYWNCVSCIEGASTGGHRDMVEYILPFLKNTISDWHFIINSSLQKAAKGGHTNVIELLIRNGETDWNFGLFGALEGNQRKLAYFFIEKGANDWAEALNIAARVGNREFVDFFILKGANDWNSGLYNAAVGRNRDMIDFFILMGADKLDQGLYGASESGDIETVKFFLTKKLRWSPKKYLRNAVVCANFYSHKEVVDYLISKGGPIPTVDLDFLESDEEEDEGLI